MRTYALAAVAAAALAGAIAVPAAAAPKGAVGAVETYRAYGGTACLASDGGAVAVVTCANAPAQQWTPQVADGLRTLRNVAAGKCLVTDNGRQVLLGDCAAAGDTARWRILRPVNDGVQFKSAATGLCVDNYRGKLIMSPCAAELFAHQTWQ